MNSLDTSYEIDYLSKQECENLIKTTTNIKHLVMVFIMLDGGLRVSECVSLKLNDFDFRKRTFKVLSLKKRTKKKYRTIPISDRLYDAMAQYVASCKIEGDSWLFPSEKSSCGHITRDAVNKFLKRNVEKHNIENIHPHALRHTCATQHLSTGADLVQIKEFLGHESINTTTIYTHIPSEVLRANVQRATAETKGFFERLRDKFIRDKKTTIINIPTAYNLPCIGRKEMLNRVMTNAEKRISTILVGGIGIGKSHILKSIEFGEQKVLKLDDVDSIKKSLVYMLLYLYKNEKEEVMKLLYSDFDLEQIQVKLNRESIASLCDEIKRLVQPKEYVLLIDNVDRITPRSVKALEELKDTFTIITSAREIPINKSSFLWNFDVLEIKELERKYSIELIHRLSHDMEVEDYELYRNHIWEQSNGNPRVIYETIDRYRKEPIISNEVVREIRHMGSLREIDMSLVIIMGLASLAILRYLSHEVDNDSYRFLGGAAMALLIISRYFFRHSKRKFV